MNTDMRHELDEWWRIRLTFLATIRCTFIFVYPCPSVVENVALTRENLSSLLG